MRVPQFRIALLGAFGCLLTVSAIFAVVRIVDDDDPAADFASIQPAINASSTSTGDVVEVRCGRYTENIVIKNGISVIAAQGPECTILDGGQAGSVVTFEDVRENITLAIPPTEFSGFTIQNGRSAQGAGMFLANSTPIITRNFITGNTATRTQAGYYGFGGGIALYNSAGVISNNVIVGNIAEHSGGGIDMYFSYPKLRSNTIIGNSAASAPGGSSAYGGAVYGLFSDPTLHSNIIFDNSADAGGGGIDFINSETSTIEFTDIFQNLPVDINGTFDPGAGGNISQDPMFLETGSLAVCLRSNSPLIDAGVLVGTLDLTDFFGRPRHIDGNLDGIIGDGARIDMGACEGGDISRLMVETGGVMSWDPSINTAADFNLYRGILSVLKSSCATTCLFTQDPVLVSGANRECGLTSPMFTDPDVPPVGEVYIYYATGESVIEGVLDFAADGSVLSNDNPCP